jgi:hypothetical protein
MLIVLLSVLATVSVARGAWLLHHLWRTLPRRNADFGLM